MKRRRTSADSWAETPETSTLVLRPGKIAPEPTGRMTVLTAGTQTTCGWETFSFTDSEVTFRDLAVCSIGGEICRAAELVSGDQTVYIVPPPDVERALLQKMFAKTGKKINLRLWATRTQTGKVPCTDADTAMFGSHLYVSAQLAAQILTVPPRKSRPKQRLPVHVTSTVEIHVSQAEAAGLLTGTLTLIAVPAPATA